MSVRIWKPCDELDLDGHYLCPYAEDGDYPNCEYWCGADEPEPAYYDESEDYEK